MILHTKLIKYLSNIKENRKFHNFDDKLFQAPKKKAIMICIRKGNNSLLIKELIKRRWWLTLSQEENETSPNFVWSQLKEK